MLASEFATMSDAVTEIGIGILAQRGGGEGILPNSRRLRWEVLQVAIDGGDLAALDGADEPLYTVDEQADAPIVLRRLRAKLAEANAQVMSALSTACILKLPPRMPVALRWATLEILNYELMDRGNNEDDLQRWEHAHAYLARVRSGAERIPGATYEADINAAKSAKSGGSFRRIAACRV